MAKYPKVCIVGLKCYDLLSGAETPRYLGGIENQLVLLAQGLAARGFPVSVVTFDHGQPEGIEYSGITIHKAFISDTGIPFIRFVHPRWTGLCSALDRADADIYYQMGAGCETGQVAMWCKKKQKHFIFAAGSDSDCLSNLPLLKSRREKYLYRYGIRSAGAIISLTNKQRKLLQRHYGLTSELIHIFTPCAQYNATPFASAENGKRRRILWIGRISPEKRPHLLLDISQKSPEFTIDVIGNANTNTEYEQEFYRRAAARDSIVLHGKVSLEVLRKLYSEAILLLGTSEIEGFPVTFIEAWSYGIPVVSTFDPDDTIKTEGLGFVADDVEEIVSRLRELKVSPESWQKVSSAARQYYLTNHSIDACMPKFERLFLNLTG
jgi:glycosyltransferase involved in cell wall biosynthesis